jgi:hypothetical protein
MMDVLKTLYRHYRLADLPALIAAGLATGIPLGAGLVLPVLWAAQPEVGLGFLLGGLLTSGLVMGVSGRLLDRRFRDEKPSSGNGIRAAGAGWAEGLVLGAVLLGLFQLAFSSVPFYWSQQTAFGWFSLGTLALGTLLIFGALPYFLPVRRREGLGLLGSLRRSFVVMNTRPLLALGGLGLGILTLGASAVTLGLFPGLGGLAALHQGLYDEAIKEN